MEAPVKITPASAGFEEGVNVPPFDLTDYRHFFFTIIGDNGSAEGTYGNGDRFVETSLSKNINAITGNIPTSLSIGGLFPNPASTQVNVIIDAPKRDKIMVIVTDMGGKTVIQQQANVDIGSNTVPVDIAKLAGGSYMVKLTCQSSDCQTVGAKFNKQ